MFPRICEIAYSGHDSLFGNNVQRVNFVNVNGMDSGSKTADKSTVLLNAWFTLTKTFRITGFLWEESIGDRWVSLTKGR